MTRNILIYGLIAGLIITIQMVFMVRLCYDDPNFKGSEIVGYTTMIVAFSMVFVGIRNYRNQYHGGSITFGEAFKIGAGIALIAATMYVLTWLVYYYNFVPDFMEKYTEHVLTQAASEGATATELAAKTKEMQGFGEMYKNPLFVIVMTYAEVLPIGLVIAAINALILKRKPSAGNDL